MPPTAAAAPAPAAGDAAAAAQPAARPNPLGGLVRMFFMWYLARAFFGGGGQTPVAKLPRESQLWPALARGTPVDLAFFLSEVDAPPTDWAAVGGPVWAVAGVPLGVERAERSVTVEYTPSKAVQRNASLYFHALLAPAGTPLDPALPGYDPSAVHFRTWRANAHLPRPKNKTGVLLLEAGAGKGKDGKAGGGRETGDATPGRSLAGFGGGKDGGGGGDTATAAAAAAAAEAKAPREIISYLKPNLTVAFIDEFSAFPANAVPPHYKDVLAVDLGSMTYAPMAWLNDFWLLRDKLVPLNETTGTVTLRLSLYAQRSWQHMMLAQLQESFRLQQSWGAMNEGEPDDLKRILTEGNPYFLALTMVVSLAHSVLDVLAFKADVGFWKGKQDVKGLSVRTIAFNAGCQFIILLYLFDNDTSLVVLGSSVMGLAVELWKLTQAMDVSVERGGRGTGPPPPPPGAPLATRLLAGVSAALPFRIVMKDKASYTESDTDRFDKEATRYMGIALVPCVLGYSLYSLKTQTHRSFYSWAVASLVGAVYAFGFVLMCPQLWINYRLKSVAHLPWRQLAYKFLGTIVDDLFAFVIKMPTLHRLAVFRDDIVFCVYLYQRWAYRVDRTRANEYGFAAEAPAGGAAADAGAGANAAAVVAGGAVPDAAPQAGVVRRRGAGAAADADAAGGTGDAAKEEDKKEL